MASSELFFVFWQERNYLRNESSTQHLNIVWLLNWTLNLYHWNYYAAGDGEAEPAHINTFKDVWMCVLVYAFFGFLVVSVKKEEFTHTHVKPLNTIHTHIQTSSEVFKHVPALVH